MKIFDVEQCYGYLRNWQDTEPVPCTDLILEDEIFGHHML